MAFPLTKGYKSTVGQVPGMSLLARAFMGPPGPRPINWDRAGQGSQQQAQPSPQLTGLGGAPSLDSYQQSQGRPQLRSQPQGAAPTTTLTGIAPVEGGTPPPTMGSLGSLSGP